jgi:hypothetical protein
MINRLVSSRFQPSPWHRANCQVCIGRWHEWHRSTERFDADLLRCIGPKRLSRTKHKNSAVALAGICHIVRRSERFAGGAVLGSFPDHSLGL